MSNQLSVRRTIFQEINNEGILVGEPTFGVIAADDYMNAYNDTFESLDELNKAIDKAGCILAVIDGYESLFPHADSKKIGINNFYGKDWQEDIDIDEDFGGSGMLGYPNSYNDDFDDEEFSKLSNLY